MIFQKLLCKNSCLLSDTLNLAITHTFIPPTLIHTFIDVPPPHPNDIINLAHPHYHFIPIPCIYTLIHIPGPGQIIFSFLIKDFVRIDEHVHQRTIQEAKKTS